MAETGKKNRKTNKQTKTRILIETRLTGSAGPISATLQESGGYNLS